MTSIVNRDADEEEGEEEDTGQVNLNLGRNRKNLPLSEILRQGDEKRRRLDRGSSMSSPQVSSQKSFETSESILNRKNQSHVPSTSTYLSNSQIVGLPSSSSFKETNRYDEEGKESREEEEREAPPPQLDMRILLPSEGEPRSYHIIIRQAPKKGRVCTLGSKNRRLLDPLPILQLLIYDRDHHLDEDAQSSPHLMMQARLVIVQEHGNSPTNNPTPQSVSFSPIRLLEGKLMSSNHIARDLDGERACFFLFPDLSIKIPGIFRLRFVLLRLGSTRTTRSAASGQIVSECMTEPFTVYNPRQFPGMSESTALARTLASQGIQIPIRNLNNASRSAS